MILGVFGSDDIKTKEIILAMRDQLINIMGFILSCILLKISAWKDGSYLIHQTHCFLSFHPLQPTQKTTSLQ